MKISTYILAAGSSLRLGKPKQLLVWRGKTLLRRAIDTAISFGELAVVLGENTPSFLGEIPEGVTILLNPGSSEGLASSLRVAVAHAITQKAECILFLLCDQPFVSEVLLAQMISIQEKTQQSAVVCRYGPSAWGVPILLTSVWFEELLTLKGDTGAKQILAKYPPESRAEVFFPEGRIDIDTPLEWTELNGN